MRNDPLISVVIPTYNSARFLTETVNSVIHQSYQNRELIIVDDGSTDNTLEVLKPFKEQVIYIHQDNFGGPSQPRNVGLKRAHGEWVAFFDSDDMMLPDKLSAAAQVLLSNPEADLLFTDFRIVNSDGEELRDRFLVKYQDFRQTLEQGIEESVGLLRGQRLYRELLRANFIGTSSVVVRRQLLLDAGGFDETLKNSDDRDMWFRLARNGATFAFLDEVHHVYRHRQGSVTGKGAKRFPAVIQVLESQLPYVRESEEEMILAKKIHNAKICYAWALQNEGEYDGSIDIYKSILKQRWSLRVQLGWLKARLKKLQRS